MLKRHGLRSTFFVPGLTADRYPATVEAIVAAGHEIGHHGYSHVELHRLDEGEERRELERGMSSLERITGTLPTGFRAPWWELNDRTPACVTEYGLRFDSSMMDDDRPTCLRRLMAHWPSSRCTGWLDDWEQYAFLPEPNGSVP